MLPNGHNESSTRNRTYIQPVFTIELKKSHFGGKIMILGEFQRPPKIAKNRLFWYLIIFIEVEIPIFRTKESLYNMQPFFFKFTLKNIVPYAKKYQFWEETIRSLDL